MRSLYFSLLIAFLFLSPAAAQDVKGTCATCTGFYWYEDPAKEEVKDKKENKQDDLQMPQPVIPPPLREKFTEEQLMKMHPDQIQHLVTLYLKKGVGEPTPENVKDYYTIQNVARLKSLAFTNVADYVVQTNPSLSVSKDYPLAGPGRESLKRQSQKETDDRILAARDDYALLFFYSPTCQYCEVQIQINSAFEDKYGWQIKAIDITEQPNAALRFNVDSTPYILLIGRKTDKHIPISVGVSSVSEMSERIYRGIRLLSGEITPEQWTMMEFQKNGAFDVNKFSDGK